MAREIRIKDDFVLDFFNTRQGKKITKGTSGDKITLEDICKKPEPERVNRVKSAPQIDKTLLQLIQLGFQKTHIEVLVKGYIKTKQGIVDKYETIELLRLIPPRQVKKMFPSATKVFYSRTVKGVNDETFSRYWTFSVSR